MILIATGSADVVVNARLPVPSCNGICVAFSVTCLPTTPVAWITSLPCVAWISWVRLLLVVICCSTLLNWTSSVVNVLASIGLAGSWFFSCVSSRLRKLLKLLLSEVSALARLARCVATGGAAAGVADVAMAAHHGRCSFKL